MLRSGRMTKKSKVFLVDDHAVLRGGMRRLIEMEPDFQVCGEASDAIEALEKLPSARPDIALLDLGLKKFRLITNNPRKIIGLEGYDLEILDRVALPAHKTEFNEKYLKTKRDKMDHLL